MFELNLTPSVIYSLQQTCRWARIFVFISAGGIIVGAAILFAVWDALDRRLYDAYGEIEAYIGGALAVGAIIYLGLLALLFNFTVKVKKGLDAMDMPQVEQGMSSLKLYFLISGIIGVVYTLIAAFTVYKLIIS